MTLSRLGSRRSEEVHGIGSTRAEVTLAVRNAETERRIALEIARAAARAG